MFFQINLTRSRALTGVSLGILAAMLAPLSAQAAGKTFRYDAAGTERLAGNKRVIIAISRGGFYGAGTPTAAMEHLETDLRGVFGFICVANPEIIVAEGLLVGPEQREKAMQSALAAATTLRAA